MTSRRFEVPKGEKTSLERFLVKAVPNATDARVRQWLTEGRVRINGKLAKVGRKTWGGEVVVLELPPPPPPRPVEGPTLGVLAENARFVIIDKPAGLTVEPEPNQVSVTELLAHQRGGFDVGGASLPGVAHRLDKDTSGCLAFATSDEALAELRDCFERKLVTKRYLAFVAGEPPDQGALDTPYSKGSDGRYTTRLESPRRARLSWTARRRFVGAACLEVTLDTGRTHQIRVQLSEAGFPVLGDRVYGAVANVPAPRLALHAERLVIEAPSGTIEALAPLPADLATLTASLEAMRG